MTEVWATVEHVLSSSGMSEPGEPPSFKHCWATGIVFLTPTHKKLLIVSHGCFHVPLWTL